MSEGNWQPKDRMMLFLVFLHAVVKKKGVCQLAPLQTLRGLAGLKHLADAGFMHRTLDAPHQLFLAFSALHRAV